MPRTGGGVLKAVPVTDDETALETIASARSPYLDRVQETYGEDAAQGLRHTFRQAYLERNQEAFDFFLGRREVPPPVDGKVQPVTAEVVDVMDLVAKMLVYAPEEWFGVVTGGVGAKEELKTDLSRIGVAYDASSRLRRAGLELYHARLSKLWGDGLLRQRKEHEGRPLAFYWWPERRQVAAEETNVDVRSYGPGGDLPEKAPGHDVRVVCVSDTHLLHRRLNLLPPGDILLHTGDLCFEESRSVDRTKFEEVLAQARAGSPEEKAKAVPVNTRLVQRLQARHDIGLIAALEWLGSVRPASGEFKARLLIGGNHDYILRQIVKELGVAAARELCAAFGKVQYLDDSDEPVDLRMGPSMRPVRVWGSAVSVMAGVADDRAVVSGNNSWMWDPTQEEEFEHKVLSKVKDLGPVDILMTHTPPKPGCLHGKEKRTFPCVYEAIASLQPSLYVCGHEHNDANIFKDRIIHGADFVEGVVGVHAAQVGRWNHAHGVPIVVDLKLRDR